MDKRWHYVGVMPDLSDESEEKCLAEAHKAFLIGILYEWVKFDKDQYRILDKNGDNINENIIVEDGRCNKLIEIYHAMLMSRPLVLSMIERYNDEILKEKSSTAKGSRDYTFMKLHENMRKAHLKAFEHIPVISIFELPILCKASAGDSVYGDEDAISMLKNILVFVEDYLREFYNDPYVRNPYYANWMNEQILLMIENLQNYYVLPDKTILANPLHDSLVKRIGSIVIKKIESFELCPEAVEITKNLNETWKRLTE